MRVHFAAAGIAIWMATTAYAVQTKPSQTKKSSLPRRYEFRADHDPDGIGKFYMGREIARVMGHQAADWLDREEREQEERPDKLMKALDVKKGQSIADIGAGTGYFTFRFAKKVGEKGKVYAVDIQPQMLSIIDKRAKDRNVKNVELVQGTIEDPRLPANSIDWIVMVDVYHEFSHPFEMTESMVKSLKPGGKIVFVEYRLEDPSVPIKRLHRMSEKQVKKEMVVHELKYVQTISDLPLQHVIVFEKKSAEKDTKSNSKPKKNPLKKSVQFPAGPSFVIAR